jgi:hypothetical protein
MKDMATDALNADLLQWGLGGTNIPFWNRFFV